MRKTCSQRRPRGRERLAVLVLATLAAAVVGLPRHGSARGFCADLLRCVGVPMASSNGWVVERRLGRVVLWISAVWLDDSDAAFAAGESCFFHSGSEFPVHWYRMAALRDHTGARIRLHRYLAHHREARMDASEVSRFRLRCMDDPTVENRVAFDWALWERPDLEQTNDDQLCGRKYIDGRW